MRNYGFTVQLLKGAALFLLALAPASHAAAADDPMRELKKLADKGDAQAQYQVGFYYAAGDARVKSKPDISTAVKYYRKAAEAGIPQAQYKLAYILEHGGNPPFRSIKQNDKEAAEWYRKAAEKGVPEACYALAQFYKTERGGLTSDYREQFRWLQEAALMGMAAAQSEVADYYRIAYGGVVQRDYVYALAWAMLAAQSGDARGLAIRAELPNYSSSNRMTPQQIADAEKMAEALAQKINANIAKRSQ